MRIFDGELNTQRCEINDWVIAGVAVSVQVHDDSEQESVPGVVQATVVRVNNERFALQNQAEYDALVDLIQAARILHLGS